MLENALIITKDNVNTYLNMLINNPDEMLVIKPVIGDFKNTKIYNVYLYNKRPTFMLNNVYIKIINDKHLGNIARVTSDDPVILYFFTLLYNMILYQAIGLGIITPSSEQKPNLDLPTIVNNTFTSVINETSNEKNRMIVKTNFTELIGDASEKRDTAKAVELLKNIRYTRIKSYIVMTFDSFRVTDKYYNFRPRLVEIAYVTPPPQSDINEQQRIQFIMMARQVNTQNNDDNDDRINKLNEAMSKTHIRAIKADDKKQ